MPAYNTMPDEQVITKEDEKQDKPLLEEVREKSFHQILKEQAEARKVDPTAPLPTEKSDEEKKKEADEQAVKEAEEAKRKVEEEEAARKRDEEIAKKAADEILAKQKAEEEKKSQETKALEEAKQREEALKPKFTGKDKDGNPVPKSYEEIVAEAKRIAKEETKAEVLAELKAQKDKEEQEKQTAAKTEEEKKAQQKAVEDQLQKELDADLTDLYTQGKLPKIKDPNDPNDIGNKEFANLFETAQKVNAERMAKGEAPIRSIKMIYYEHYKPLGKVAGHDAPVLGSESPLSHEAPDDKYIPSRDRNKSMAQLIKEETQRLSRKLNIRGN